MFRGFLSMIQFLHRQIYTTGIRDWIPRNHLKIGFFEFAALLTPINGLFCELLFTKINPRMDAINKNGRIASQGMEAKKGCVE